ncbi:MAG TPA: TetR/AcrR family transcriptional regulator [Bdellovibrio sp.]|nr:TetR/AcrR family transcriptional regulator [Bdellovibrio sp.]
MNKSQYELKKTLFNKRLGISEHRQFQIMETALELIQRDGFEHLQFGLLAKKCRVSRGLVHHYFKDKFELANKLLDLSTLYLQSYLQNSLAQVKHPKQQLEIYCKATVDWPVSFPKHATGLFLFLHLCSHNKKMRQRNDELSALGRQKIQLLLLEAGAESSGIQRHAQMIQTLLSGCYLILLSENRSEKESQKVRIDCVKACLEIAGLSRAVSR